MFVVVALLAAVPALGGTITRATKTASGTGDYLDGSTILTAEVNADFNDIYSEFNGNIENINIKAGAAIAYSKLNLTSSIVTGDITDGTILNADLNASAGIETSKIDDDSTDAAEQATTSSPGTSDNPTLATDLSIELTQLRRKIEELTVGTSASAVASGAGTAALASWIDGPLRPGNHIYNGGFDAWQQADCSPCASSEGGWDLVLTPDLADTALTESEGAGDGNGMLITGNGAALEGISQTIDGLKADTSYLAVASVRPTTGDSCRMVTTGADTNQLSVDSAADNAFEVISGIFETDSTPTDVVLQLLAVADTDICLFDHVGVYEINTDPAPRHGTTVTNVVITDSATSLVDGTPTAIAGMTATVTPPVPGCSVSVDAAMSANTVVAGNNTADFGCELFEGATLLSTVASDIESGTTVATTIQMSYMGGNKTPGTALTYTVKCQDNYDTSDTTDAQTACAMATDTVLEGPCYVNVKMECDG